MTTQPYRTVALVASAALRDDDASVRKLLHSYHPVEGIAIAEAAILAMAEIVRTVVPPETIREALTGAQTMARSEATHERNPR